MPIGPYADFGECVGAQKRKGKSDASARRICGAMERDLGGKVISREAFSSWESCMDKITEKYDEETAKKICGALRAEGQASLTASNNKPITKFTNPHGKLFVKAFLIDSSVNLNQWAVTEESIPENINTFIGKPLILTADFDHPHEGVDTLSHMLRSQEGFRVGTITDIDTKLNPATGSTAYYALIEITDPALRDSLLNTDIPHYVSPGIAEPAQLAELHREDQIGTWHGMHLALVDNPAYGINKARITNTCSGDKKDCLIQLMSASQKCNFCRYEALKQYRLLVASLNTSHAQKSSPNTKKRMSQLESIDSSASNTPNSKEEGANKAVETVEEPKLLNKAPVPQPIQAPRGMRDILEENQRLLHELELSHLKIEELTNAHATVQDRIAALELRDRRKDIERIVTPDVIKDDKQRLAKIKELTASQIPIDQIENLYKEMRVLVKKASVNQRASGVRVPYVTSNLNTVGSTAVENDGNDLTLLDKQLFCIDRRI